VRGKKAKALRVDRTAEREAVRRKQRQQTLFTVIVIAIIVGIGGVLVVVSMDRTPADLADEPTEFPTDFPTEGPDDRPVACEAEAPANADEPKPTFDEPEQVLEDGTDYGAVITTSCGRIRVDLLEEESPETVNSFVFLAQQGFFDGLEIFRNATSIGALQTGSGTNDASWDVGYTIADELGKAEEDGYPVGALAMANAGPDTAGSQFFFVYNDSFDTAFADNRAYAVFGLANERGQRVLDRIGSIAVEAPDDPASPGAERPTEITYIESVEITTE
jgi:peptidyl-prolyl cis-trans isomerase B (cyclophilin B)